MTLAEHFNFIKKWKKNVLDKEIFLSIGCLEVGTDSVSPVSNRYL